MIKSLKGKVNGVPMRIILNRSELGLQIEFYLYSKNPDPLIEDYKEIEAYPKRFGRTLYRKYIQLDNHLLNIIKEL